LARAADL